MFILGLSIYENIIIDSLQFIYSLFSGLLKDLDKQHNAVLGYGLIITTVS